MNNSKTVAENLKYAIAHRMFYGDTRQYLEYIATQKNKNEKNETAYIFSDGSALIMDSQKKIHVDNYYGLSPTNIQL